MPIDDYWLACEHNYEIVAKTKEITTFDAHNREVLRNLLLHLPLLCYVCLFHTVREPYQLLSVVAKQYVKARQIDAGAHLLRCRVITIVFRGRHTTHFTDSTCILRFNLGLGDTLCPNHIAWSVQLNQVRSCRALELTTLLRVVLVREAVIVVLAAPWVLGQWEHLQLVEVRVCDVCVDHRVPETGCCE